MNSISPRYVAVLEPPPTPINPRKDGWARYIFDQASPWYVEATQLLIKLGNESNLIKSGVKLLKHDETAGLVFSPGHPQSKVVYVVHPFDETRYIPFAIFHRSIFEQKVIEALELLAALGATVVEVRQVSGTEDSKKVAGSLPLGDLVDADASFGATSRSGNRSEVLYKASLHPCVRPHVPSGLQWYPHEQFWQSVARLRLTGGLLNFSLEVRHDADFGVTAKIGAKFSNLGLELGGSYSDFSTTRWEMSGTFAPLSQSGDLA